MSVSHRWRKEPGARMEGVRDLDRSKTQAPGIVRVPTGGYRLFYTAVGPARPFPKCQGYILSAFSRDGLHFETEPGIRIAPQPDIPHLSLRILAPFVAPTADGRWRMYFESRGPASMPTVICSAISDDMLNWKLEEGIRIRGQGDARAPRYLPLSDGRARMFFILTERDPISQTTLSQSVFSAITENGLDFDIEPGCRLRDRQGEFDAVGLTAGEAIPPQHSSDTWSMIFSAWQDVPAGTEVPLHPSHDTNAETNGTSEDFAAASIRCDLAGFRSRIFIAESPDGFTWGPSECIVEGGGFASDDLDAIHAEDMSVIRLDDGRYRMYYAACDTKGTWRVLSAVSE
ncbi:MAG: hypothetical protein O2955_14950 [Planctomycetota bacterium]|nr:hypothetical protein [Planctomycetota bacterium]MDA1213812.1 hypothetical protein [Planctomycetota bacterium]